MTQTTLLPAAAALSRHWPAPPAEAPRCAAPTRGPVQPGHALPRNALVLRRLRGERTLSYFLFVPANWRADRPLVVLVHGISRNAREHALAFAPHAARTGHALVAPLFDREFYRDFQQLGLPGGGRRADLALQAVVADAARETGARAERFALFGHSGGAQFAHRFALAWPQRVARLALCAAGYYTFPEPAAAFPLGLDTAALPGAPALDLAGFLDIPTVVLVGRRDTARDASLRSDADLDAHQGPHRRERARRFVAARRAATAARGAGAPTQLVELPGAGHRFTDTVARGLCEAAWPWLAGEPISHSRGDAPAFTPGDIAS